MIKKILLAIAIIFPMSALAQKFGVVEIETVFKAMPEYAAMETQLSDASKKYEDEFQKLRTELDKLYADFQAIADDANTPQSIKERRMQEIQERENKINQFRQTASQDLSRLQEQLIAPIQQKFVDAVKAVGQEGNYTFIFPNEQNLLLYQGADVVNVTNAVKTKLGL